MICDRFMADNNEGDSWVLKLPYTTNRNGLKYVRSVEELFSVLWSRYEQFGAYIPYVMLQPCMLNKREYKLIFLNGEFSHFGHNSSQGKAFLTDDETRERAVKFGQDVISLLKHQCSAAVTDGLIRVDIFRNCRGNYVVNELESLEASHWGSAGSKGKLQEDKVFVFLAEYWKAKLESLLA